MVSFFQVNQVMEYVRCGHCKKREDSITKAYEHCQKEHPADIFKVYKPFLCQNEGKKKYHLRDYQIKPDERVEGRKCLFRC